MRKRSTVNTPLIDDKIAQDYIDEACEELSVGIPMSTIAGRDKFILASVYSLFAIVTMLDNMQQDLHKITVKLCGETEEDKHKKIMKKLIDGKKLSEEEQKFIDDIEKDL
ncbi:hypothetical protein [Thermosipho sp. (in: thermotogales)]|jgi:hypothetical protein|uniref:hypothetical protein n=1 Tax=Thermosipho sp. (in: thermotogales) TaxID=1968895 RepID=UPI00257F8699|nr:hypothetical protein [Thermosipho sp. (in: thermotogales)]MBZ4649232.1 hypothetical protein [Thermosipho sp. (in: thermotogales)]